MRLVIQRVSEARVTVDNKITGEIKKGLLAFVGISKEDTEQIIDIYLKKLLSLRIFEDENGKTNLSLADVSGELLLVSQFTLYADCKKGNRPSFIQAGGPEHANRLFDYMIKKAREVVPNIQTGVFGADMKVNLENEGPFTIVLDESLLASAT